MGHGCLLAIVNGLVGNLDRAKSVSGNSIPWIKRMGTPVVDRAPCGPIQSPHDLPVFGLANRANYHCDFQPLSFI